MKRLPRQQLTWRATVVTLAVLAVLLVGIVAVNSPLPVIDQRYGDTTLNFAADRAWALWPGDCVSISWQTDSIASLHIEGRGEIGWGEKAFCPQINQKTAHFVVRTPDGIYREFQLRIHFLPDLLLYLAGFVGVVGSLGLAVYFLWTNRLERPLNSRWSGLALVSLLVLGTALHLSEPSPPRLDADDGQLAVSMWAEKGSLVFPRECLKVSFSVVGLQSLQFNGEEVTLTDNLGERKHCNAHGPTSVLEVVGTDGKTRLYELPILTLFTSLAHIPVYFYSSLVAWLLAALVYVPLFSQKLRMNWRQAEWTGFLVFAAFAFFILMIYLPFGFDNAGQWEEWVIWSYFESNSTSFGSEFPQRFLLMLPHALAYLIDNNSFIALHVLQFMVLTLQPMLVFGILKKLGLRDLYAFLIATLCIAYPVNDLLLSLPIVAINTSVMWLLLAVYCALEYLETQRRRTLVGVALALLFNVSSYEAGLAVIVGLPFFLWLHRGKLGWRQVNLAALWLSAAFFKVAYIVLLLSTDRPVYNSSTYESQDASSFLGQDIVSTAGDIFARVYRRTFFDSWVEAIASLSDNHWLPTVLSLICVGVLAVHLMRRDSCAPPPSWRQISAGLLGGALLIIPAVGVLMWLPAYNSGEMPRLFFYVPFGAAVAVFCLLLLLTAKLKDRRARDQALIAICILLLIPALSRLFVQHEMYTRSANTKALIFRQILELVPRPQPDTYLLVITPMSRSELSKQLISAPTYFSMFASAMSILYEDHAPVDSFFCRYYDRCSWRWGGKGLFYLHEHADHWQDTIVLELRRDLVVELVEDPFTRYGWEIDINYDPSQLYAADAPLPPRAHTMLGASIRHGAD